MFKFKNSGLLLITLVLAIGTLFCLEPAFAASKDLKGISEGMYDQIKSVASLMIIVAYVAGVGFALAGIMQLKAHKDSPQQTPLSKPIVYLVVGACLLFLPTLISSSGQTIFGTDKGDSAAKFGKDKVIE